MAIQEIKIKDITPGENYRRHQSKGGMKELAASIKSHGVLQPIIVRKVKKGYEIIAGHRRHEAAEAAGLKVIPASVLNVDDSMALEIAVIENTQREDPNPMDEALGFKRLLDMGKHTPDTLAKKLDKSLSYVYTRLKLNDLPKDCQKALLSGEVEFGIALQLCRLTDKKDMSDMLREILDQDMSAAQVRYHIQTSYGQRLDGVPFDKTACDKCKDRSTTQSALFPGVDGEDDRCMNEKCWHGKYIDHLEMLGRDATAGGWSVIREPEEVRRLDRKGVRIHHLTPLKPKCKPCKERAFFYSDENNRIVYGWWCPSKKCNDEVYYGIKPREKADKATRGHGDAGEEQGQEAEAPTGESCGDCPEKECVESDKNGPCEKAMDKVNVPGLTDAVVVECPCCFMDIRLVPQVADVDAVVEGAEVINPKG